MNTVKNTIKIALPTVVLLICIGLWGVAQEPATSPMTRTPRLFVTEKFSLPYEPSVILKTEADGDVVNAVDGTDYFSPSSIDGDRGDITVSSSGASWTINNNVVELANLQQIETGRLLGRFTASTGNVEALSIAANVESLLGAADYAAMRGLLDLEVGTDVQAYNANLTTYAGIAPSANIQTLLGSADYSAARTNLGLVIGTNVQAYDADLTTYAGITPSANIQSLLGSADYAAARTNLGLGTIATQAADDVALTGGTITGLGELSYAANIFNNPSNGQFTAEISNLHDGTAGVYGLFFDRASDTPGGPAIVFKRDGDTQWAAGPDVSAEVDYVVAYHGVGVSYYDSSADLIRIDGLDRSMAFGPSVTDPSTYGASYTFVPLPDTVNDVHVLLPRRESAFGGNDVRDSIRMVKGSDSDRCWLHWSQGSGAGDWRLGMVGGSQGLAIVSANGATDTTAASPGTYVAQFDSGENFIIGTISGAGGSYELPITTPIDARLRLLKSDGARMQFSSSNHPINFGQPSDSQSLVIRRTGQTAAAAGTYFHTYDGTNFQGGISIGVATLNTKAILQGDSTTKGWLPPRMPETQRGAITSPPEGWIVAGRTSHALAFCNG